MEILIAICILITSGCLILQFLFREERINHEKKLQKIVTELQQAIGKTRITLGTVIEELEKKVAEAEGRTYIPKAPNPFAPNINDLHRTALDTLPDSYIDLPALPDDTSLLELPLLDLDVGELDSFGSGSGLLDLTLQADDTSLGGILDEIYAIDTKEELRK